MGTVNTNLTGAIFNGEVVSIQLMSPASGNRKELEFLDSVEFNIEFPFN